MTTRLRIGYIPLVDATLLLVADKFGFAAEEGLALELVPEVSWANIRDKLNLGIFDAAHLLAPAAIAASLGLGQVRSALVAPVALNLNGNAITISTSLRAEMEDVLDGDAADPAATAAALGRIARGRHRNGLPQITLGHVFPFSTHHYQLRAWLRSGGVDPDQDVNLVVLPPAFMAESLKNGQLEGFCVGAPWNSIAVASGHAVILHLGCDIVPNAPEKVLALRAEQEARNPESTAMLIRAIRRSAQWLTQPEARRPVAAMLADTGLFGASEELLLAILRGSIVTAPGAEGRPAPDYIRLGPETLAPNLAHAAWLVDRMVEAGQMPDAPELRDAAMATYRPDLFASVTAP
ncbi:nitrate transporter [Alsobacter metallidurans]|uniref:Nitrate transporter n=1 Tax=Alsobacter metallidurans TaxID=340221 RepID=A0A917I492_9HYPH|nr:CmpA/NrtA family ABC transporter substrate-binding protein [Alsobacter metallidurans]GGH13049.1 nitrate transporter [Alsobacter metallidurans]